jgi:hypothetical protein
VLTAGRCYRCASETGEAVGVERQGDPIVIYNTKKNFLFVHIQKTAGTSISNALMKIFGSEFIAPAHLLFRDVEISGERPYVFTVVRNPWERMVSWYEMMVRKGSHNDFSRYLLYNDESQSPNINSFSSYIRRCQIIRETRYNEIGRAGVSSNRQISWDPNLYFKSLGFNQIDYVTDPDGRIMCDFVLRFESLEADWKKLLKNLDIGPTITLPRENENPFPVDYKKYYSSAADIEWIADLYARDVERFGFSFDDGLNSDG